MVLDSFFNAIFEGVINYSPLSGVLVVSFVFAVLVTLVYKYSTDQEVLKSLKEEMKELRKEMKDFKDNPDKMMEIQKKSFEKSMQQMKMQFLPMIITFIPLLILFGWLSKTYADKGALIIGLSWIWVYIISSIIFGIALRKLLRVH